MDPRLPQARDVAPIFGRGMRDAVFIRESLVLLVDREITGGTGRFRDAAGPADFQAVLGPQGQVEADFAGSIRY